jgi:hypothetical protein
MLFNPAIYTQLATMEDGENMIIGEVYFFYRPIVASLAGVTGATATQSTSPGAFSVAPRTLVRRLFLHPRNGSLRTLPPAHPATQAPCP